MEKNKTVVIKYSNGEVAGVAETNQKGFNKSIENGHLWVVDCETARLLPYTDETQFVSLTDKNEWIECVFPLNNTESDSKAAETEAKQTKTSTKRTEKEDNDILSVLDAVIRERHETMPEGSYTTHLFSKGHEKIRKKTGEECFELVLADTKENITYEAADLIYHMMVLLESENISIFDVLAELKRREG